MSVGCFQMFLYLLIWSCDFSSLACCGMDPSGSVVKNPPANAGDTGDMDSIPGSGRSPGEGNGNPLQYSCLENPMDKGAWQGTVHGVAKSQTRLSNWTCMYYSDWFLNAAPALHVSMLVLCIFFIHFFKIGMYFIFKINFL